MRQVFPFSRLVVRDGGCLLRLPAFRLADRFRPSLTLAEIGRQFGMLAEGSVGSDRAPEHDAGLRHGRSDDVRIVDLLRRTLLEEIAVGAPRFQSRFHRRSGDCQIEEAQGSLESLQFPRHTILSQGRPPVAIAVGPAVSAGSKGSGHEEALGV